MAVFFDHNIHNLHDENRFGSAWSLPPPNRPINVVPDQWLFPSRLRIRFTMKQLTMARDGPETRLDPLPKSLLSMKEQMFEQSVAVLREYSWLVISESYSQSSSSEKQNTVRNGKNFPIHLCCVEGFEFARLPWPSFHIIGDVAGASHNMVQGMVQGNSLARDAYLPHLFGIWPLI